MVKNFIITQEKHCSHFEKRRKLEDDVQRSKDGKLIGTQGNYGTPRDIGLARNHSINVERLPPTKWGKIFPKRLWR